MPEMEEFLPHGAEKKQTHFTDVSFCALYSWLPLGYCLETSEGAILT